MESESLDSILGDNTRKIVVCKCDINLSKKNDNIIFILFVQESHGSAGGRIGGSGVRTINRIVCFVLNNMDQKKIFDTSDYNAIYNFEIPLSAVAMDITLSNQTIKVIQGIVDEELVNSYLKIIK